MLIGIDVGGTFTDGVVFQEGKIIDSVKVLRDGSIKDSLLQVLDRLLQGKKKEEIKRLVLSTTVVTNLITTDQGDPTAVILLPGSGLPYDLYDISPHTYYIKGSVNFKGDVLEPLDKKEILQVLKDIDEKSVKKIAVVCKFSNRNQILENKVRELIQKQDPAKEVFIGSEIAGKLNFPRRAVTTYYTAMTCSHWNRFADEIEQSLRERGLDPGIDILKADGGTMPLHVSRSKPCETVFSGPAASTMGAVALTMHDKNSVVIDIGGTTTDISLLIEGAPLYASKGARIHGKLTHINSFALRSISLGGDSRISVAAGGMQIGPERLGVAACFGGPAATISDAFNYYFDLGLGQAERSGEEMTALAGAAGMEPRDLAGRIVEEVRDRIITTVLEMFKEWENEPAYKVWEIVNKRKFELQEIIGIGAGASTIVPLVAEKMGVPARVHPYSPVANALGACVARPTLAFEMHVDTHKGKYFIEQEGTGGVLENAARFQLEDARALALQRLQEIAGEKGLSPYVDQAEFFLEEQFNMVRGWKTVGKIFEIGIQISPGLIHEYEGVL